MNDIQVSEEKEEVVFNESVGGNANANAYCLVYNSDTLVQSELEARNDEGKMVDEKETPINRGDYPLLLTKELNQLVEEDNKKF